MPIYQKTEARRTQAVAARPPARPARPKPRSRTSRSKPEGFRISLIFGFIRDYASFLIFAGAVLALVVLYNLFTASPVFELKEVEISRASPGVRGEVEQTVRRVVGSSRLMDVDLTALRQKVEALSRVREASVARVLPDKIFVEVGERQPAVLVRRGNGALAWLDDEAIEVGEFAMQSGSSQKVPPPAIGFAEGPLTAGAMMENRERVTLYKQIEQEFAANDTLWSKVDEIDLSSTKYVNVRLANSTINVALGSENFRNRFETAINVLKAVEDYNVEQLSRYNVRDIEQVLANADTISYIYPARNNGIVFNFSTPKSEKRASAGTRPTADTATATTPKAALAVPEARKTSPIKTAARKDDNKKAVKKASPSAQGKSPSSKKQAPGKKK